MAISKEVLGMNARNFLYIGAFNTAKAKRRADDKLATKRLLLRDGISVPGLLASFKRRNDIFNFDWTTLPESFVLKPSHGYGGEGIIVMKTWDGEQGESMGGTHYSLHDLESHVFDILEGAYSLGSIEDTAFIEERVTPQRFFKKILPVGMPDLRIIVFNGVPVMAMLRIPTEESGGKANIHLGAIGVGIDVSTGITTRAIRNRKKLEVFPNTKIKPHGLKVPNWDSILRLSIEAQRSMELWFAGVDIVIDENLGPVILEVNARPGLEIQNANRASLRTRLERVDGMAVPSVDRGIDIAKSLFVESFSEKVSHGGPGVLGVNEPVAIKYEGGTHEVTALIDTGAFRTSLDVNLADTLGLKDGGEVVKTRSASGHTERLTREVTFVLGNKTVTTTASVIDRKRMKYPMIIGRRDMEGFIVDPMWTGVSDDDDDDLHEQEE